MALAGLPEGSIGWSHSKLAMFRTWRSSMQPQKRRLNGPNKTRQSRPIQKGGRNPSLGGTSPSLPTEPPPPQLSPDQPNLALVRLPQQPHQLTLPAAVHLPTASPFHPPRQQRHQGR